MSVEVITKADFEKAMKAQSVWDVGNEVLYKLCRDYPNHAVAEHIVAKTWLIGRSYAVSLERGRDPEIDVETFYVECVVRVFKNSTLDLDRKLASFTPQHQRTRSSLDLHKRLVDELRTLSKKEKAQRSFASKYLHFHCPEHFFIYDGLAAASITKLTERPKSQLNSQDCDPDYGDFFSRCEQLSDSLTSTIGRSPTPRELDKVLLYRSLVGARKAPRLD